VNRSKARNRLEGIGFQLDEESETFLWKCSQELKYVTKPIQVYHLVRQRRNDEQETEKAIFLVVRKKKLLGSRCCRRFDFVCNSKVI
jgi:hypothetical protein